MKKIIIYSLFAGIGLLFSGCLDIPPVSGVPEGDFYKSTADMNSAVIACYGGLQAPLYWEWQLTELRTDNSRLRTSSTTSSTSIALMQLDQEILGSDHPRVYEYWSATYKNIGRCNQVLDSTHLAVCEPEPKRQFEGEALFIRAYHYFNLVRLFGPVPLVTRIVSKEQAKKQSRQPESVIYKQIEQDLIIAIDSLPTGYNNEISKYQNQDNIGRATKWAAKALLAKVYITQSKFTLAYPILEDMVEGAGRYNFNIADISYDQIFHVENEMNKEILFAVRYTSGGYGLGCPFGNQFAPSNSGANIINGDGEDQNYPCKDLINGYETIKNPSGVVVRTDLRKAATLKETYLDRATGKVINRSYCIKYLSPVVTKYDGESDFPIIRWADVILMYSEVLNEMQGPTAKVFSYLNQIRNRAGLPQKEAKDATTRQQFRRLIEMERRWEFAFENQRWFDLVRMSRAIEVLNNHFLTEANETGGTPDLFYDSFGYPIKMEPKYLVLPIPQKEIDVYPAISQNPGY